MQITVCIVSVHKSRIHFLRLVYCAVYFVGRKIKSVTLMYNELDPSAEKRSIPPGMDNIVFDISTDLNLNLTV